MVWLLISGSRCCGNSVYVLPGTGTSPEGLYGSEWRISRPRIGRRGMHAVCHPGFRKELGARAKLSVLWKLLSCRFLPPDHQLMKDPQNSHIFVQGRGLLTLGRA